jgi:hypothetical protein
VRRAHCGRIGRINREWRALTKIWPAQIENLFRPSAAGFEKRLLKSQ